MTTIIQDYGPIYGEVVNGTVQGRPNGSIYVPISNTIAITIDPSAKLYLYSPNALVLTMPLNVVAQSQDLSSYSKISVYSDSGCTIQVGTSVLKPAGEFNGSYYGISLDTTAPTTGVDYYIRAELMNNGVAVATSNVVKVVGQ